jgi:hypothetical protein
LGRATSRTVLPVASASCATAAAASLTDQRSQPGYHGEAFFNQLPATRFVRLDTDDAFFSQCTNCISGKFNRLRQFKRNNWHRYIQFEIPRLAAKRNRRVAADGMSRDLDDRFTNFYAGQPSYLLPWTAGPSHVRY